MLWCVNAHLVVVQLLHLFYSFGFLIFLVKWLNFLVDQICSTIISNLQNFSSILKLKIEHQLISLNLLQFTYPVHTYYLNQWLTLFSEPFICFLLFHQAFLVRKPLNSNYLVSHDDQNVPKSIITLLKNPRPVEYASINLWKQLTIAVGIWGVKLKMWCDAKNLGMN